ncbi:hypothetical protein [Aldersonia kunmingensis]|uniref:hypothetical protein n=1 Tax=Aldersonia kunmingensis TaxID=408066 RepID=UPI000A9D9E1A|nr:hypothetical protein [Aldersonia kunmingensis]
MRKTLATVVLGAALIAAAGPAAATTLPQEHMAYGTVPSTGSVDPSTPLGGWLNGTIPSTGSVDPSTPLGIWLNASAIAGNIIANLWNNGSSILS